jgi:predicted nucleotidyltransferase
MINIDEKYLKILKSILSQYSGYEFYLFGSRITNRVKPFSDIDLLYFDNISDKELSQLKEDLEESNLPYKVDLVNYNKCSASFKKIIGNSYVRID